MFKPTKLMSTKPPMRKRRKTGRKEKAFGFLLQLKLEANPVLEPDKEFKVGAPPGLSLTFHDFEPLSGDFRPCR